MFILLSTGLWALYLTWYRPMFLGPEPVVINGEAHFNQVWYILAVFSAFGTVVDFSWLQAFGKNRGKQMYIAATLSVPFFFSLLAFVFWINQFHMFLNAAE